MTYPRTRSATLSKLSGQTCIRTTKQQIPRGSLACNGHLDSCDASTFLRLYWFHTDVHIPLQSSQIVRVLVLRQHVCWVVLACHLAQSDAPLGDLQLQPQAPRL